MKFQWKKNGEDISEENIRLKEDNEFTMLIFDIVKINDGGNYTCTVSNMDGTDSFSAYLEVKGEYNFSIFLDKQC